MSGVIENLTPREAAMESVALALRFPWRMAEKSLLLQEFQAGRPLHPVHAAEDFPPCARSTRDGYAVRSMDTNGATEGSPSFLRVIGEISMGKTPSFALRSAECALIHTGGILPEGADAVVMAEDVEAAQGWLEVRRAVQRKENTLSPGEEFRKGDTLLPSGSMADFRSFGVLAMAGVCALAFPQVTVGILSTGDEIVPADTPELCPGQFRDVNGALLQSLLYREGYTSKLFGIVRDEREPLRRAIYKALDECDVLLVSGGSSVSTRDHCSSIMEELPSPGLLVRGVLMSPGKPLLIAGMAEEQRMIFGLPGHPFSCFVACYTVVLPLLHAMIWGDIRGPWKSLVVPAGGTVFGHTGVEEFIPCRIREGRAVPVPVKSGFVGSLPATDGLFRLPVSRETAREGEEVELWLW